MATKVTGCIFGLAAASSSSIATSCPSSSSLRIRSKECSTPGAAASLSSTPRQVWGSSRQADRFCESFQIVDHSPSSKTWAESGPRGVLSKQDGSLSRDGDHLPPRRRRRLAVRGTSALAASEWIQRWWFIEPACQLEGEMCARMGRRRRDRRWLWPDGMLHAMQVGTNNQQSSVNSLLRWRRPSLAAQAAEAASINTAIPETDVVASQVEEERIKDEEVDYTEEDDYMPQPGDEVMGVVVALDERGADVDIGAKRVGRMPIKEFVPPSLYACQRSIWDLNRPSAAEAGTADTSEAEAGTTTDMSEVEAVTQTDMSEAEAEAGTTKDMSEVEAGAAKDMSEAEAGTTDMSDSASSVQKDDESTGNDNISSSELSDEAGVELGRAAVNGVRNDDMVGSTELVNDLATSRVESTGEGSSQIPPKRNEPLQLVMEVGLEIPCMVLGETISGRTLLSARSFAERIAWERIQQLAEVRDPIEVVALDWNRGGVVSRVEGIRAFCPIPHLVSARPGSNELRALVGSKLCVQVIEYDQKAREVIVSEKRGKIQKELITNKEGTLVQGVVKKITSYGAFIDIENTLLRGLLHISRISQAHVREVESVFNVGDRIFAIVVSSEPSSGRIALSTKELESIDGLLLEDKERVFSEAPQMAALYRERLEEEEARYLEREREGEYDDNRRIGQEEEDEWDE